MIAVPDALKLVFGAASPLDVETVPMGVALMGRVTACDIGASDNLPPWPASMVDGYAVVSSDGAGEFDVVADVRAGAETRPRLSAGSVTYVATGAPMPVGADAAVKVEETRVVAVDDATGKERRIAISCSSAPGAWVRPIGCDITAGSVVLRAGTKLGASEIGLLAAVGVVDVAVYRRPIVGVLSTGDELVDPSVHELRPGKIRDSNRAMLLAAVASAGGEALDLGIAIDTYDGIRAAVTAALARVDVLLTSGGVSMGDHDFVKPLLKELGTIHVGRLAMKPSKPTTFATIGRGGHAAPVLAFGLPGNPVSSMVAFHVFVGPAIRRLRGVPEHECSPPQARARLVHAVSLDPERPEYHRGTVAWSAERGCLVAWSTGRQASSRLASMSHANALMLLPARAGKLDRDAEVEVVFIGPLSTEAPPPPDDGSVVAGGCCVVATAGGNGHGHSHGHSHVEGKCDCGHSHGSGGPPVRVVAAVLTVSDSVAAGTSTDLGGPAVVEFLQTARGIDVVVAHSAVVADDVEAIKAKLLEWSDGDESVDLIITTGGTGFAPRDMTPEATAAVLQRLTPGLTQAMMQEAMMHVPTAVLSRAVSGIRNRTLIINTPGSPKAVKENLATLAPSLPHAIRLLRDEPHGHHKAPRT